MTRRSALLFPAFLTFTLAIFSCKTPKNIYYAKEIIDSSQVVTIPQISIPVPLIQPYDLLLITFYGKGIDMTLMLNNFGGLETVKVFQSSTSEALRPGYLVSPEGFIVLPQLGQIKVAGLTLSQLKADLTEKASRLMVEPSVIVKFSSFKVTVIGEVASRGSITSQREKLTIFEALGLSGDITIYGLKDKVKVIRTQDTTTVIGELDLTSKDAFKSEFFYLKPNDVVYVPSNGFQQQQQTLNSVFPIVSIGVSIITLVVTFLALSRN